MAKENAIEFTEVKYATRKEMGNALYIQVPDEMWKKVLEYRKPFFRPLSIVDYNGSNLYLCLYPTLASKTKDIENKLNKLLEDSKGLGELNGDKEHFNLAMLSNCANILEKTKETEIEITRIRKLIVSENPYDEVEDEILHYVDAMKYIQENYELPIDEDFLAGLFSKAIGNDELTYFYRVSDIVDSASIAMVARSYSSAPFRNIEQMMNTLFSFIESQKIDVISKAVTTYFYVLYVKPFKSHNEEVASLLAKSVLAHYGYKELGALIPFENVKGDRTADANRRLFQEINNTRDITYFVSPATLILEQNVADLNDIIRDYTISEIRKDFYKEDTVTKVEEKPVEQVKPEVKSEPQPEPKPEVESVKEEVKEETIQEKEESQEEVKVERIEEVIIDKPEVVAEEKKEEPVQKEVEKVKEKPVEKVKPEPVHEEEKETPSNKELAFNYIPEEIDEKMARRLEEHLLELDTRLSKKQAYFYARHCTLGMYYSIEQYKKACKCVYETARKGMEELAEYGYYKRIEGKKKFLYTPIKRK